MTGKAIANIPESYLEYRADFTAPVFAVWTLPNPVVSSLFSALRKWEVGLGDVTWNKDPSSYKDFQITFNVSRMNALIRFGMDAATFVAVNPEWSEAPGLIELFESAILCILQTVKAEILSQEIALALHVKPGDRSFRGLMSALVNTGSLGPAEMYGISVYQDSSSFVIDKSVRYEDAVFVRLHRRFSPSTSFSEIADILRQDELRALGLLGLEELL